MKSESFKFKLEFLSNDSFGVLVLILKSESGNFEFDLKRHYVAKIIRFHSCLGCPKMNYYLNNTFVLTALDKERGAKQSMVCKKKDGGSRSTGTGTRGRW